MTKTIEISCPSCSQRLELEGEEQEWAGQTVECPECKAAIQIPMQQPPPKQLPSLPSCPSCKSEMPKNAVICVSCGFDLRTGERVDPKPTGKHLSVTGRREISACRSCGAQMYADAAVCPDCKSSQAEADSPKPKGIYGYIRALFGSKNEQPLPEMHCQSDIIQGMHNRLALRYAVKAEAGGTGGKILFGVLLVVAILCIKALVSLAHNFTPTNGQDISPSSIGVAIIIALILMAVLSWTVSAIFLWLGAIVVNIERRGIGKALLATFVYNTAWMVISIPLSIYFSLGWCAVAFIVDIIIAVAIVEWVYETDTGKAFMALMVSLGVVIVGGIVLGFFLGICIPSFTKARDTAQRNACINNLKMIDSGKEQWALAKRQADGCAVDIVGVNAYIKGQTTPVCPAGGTYTYNVIGTDPKCSIVGHEMPPTVESTNLPVTSSSQPTEATTPPIAPAEPPPTEEDVSDDESNVVVRVPEPDWNSRRKYWKDKYLLEFKKPTPQNKAVKVGLHNGSDVVGVIQNVKDSSLTIRVESGAELTLPKEQLSDIMRSFCFKDDYANSKADKQVAAERNAYQEEVQNQTDALDKAIEGARKSKYYDEAIQILSEAIKSNPQANHTQQAELFLKNLKKSLKAAIRKDEAKKQLALKKEQKEQEQQRREEERIRIAKQRAAEIALPPPPPPKAPKSVIGKFFGSIAEAFDKPSSPPPPTATAQMSLSEYLKKELPSAYIKGYQSGAEVGKVDRKFNTYNNASASSGDEIMLLSLHKIKMGSDEAGDFWEGYGDGYQYGRNELSVGKWAIVELRGVKLGYK